MFCKKGKINTFQTKTCYENFFFFFANQTYTKQVLMEVHYAYGKLYQKNILYERRRTRRTRKWRAGGRERKKGKRRRGVDGGDVGEGTFQKILMLWKGKRGFRALLFRDHLPPGLSFLKIHCFAKKLQGKEVDLLNFYLKNIKALREK